MNRSIYLDAATDAKFKQKCKQLGIKDGAATQKLIQLFVNTPDNLKYPENCLECQYYQIATSNIMQTLMRINEFFTLVQPPYERRKPKP